MSAHVLRLYGRASVPRQLQIAALVGFAVVFAVLFAYGKSGLGIGQGFFIPIVLVGLGGGATTGAAAGLVATVLYELALLDGASPRLAIHLLAYVAAGMVVGYFAQRSRAMLAEALRLLDNLLQLARRDLETGAMTAGSLQSAFARRTAENPDLGVLVAHVGSEEVVTDESLRAAFAGVAAHFGGAADVARVGAAGLVALVPPPAAFALEGEAATLERDLADRGCPATFGWALHPAEGGELLSLFSAASERLYARRLRSR